MATYEPRHAMDRGYNPVNDISPAAEIEQPLFSLREIGQTVPEQDPVTGRNILQNVQAAIRQGAGTLQIVLQTSRKQALGGGAKAIGKELRQALREVQQSTGTHIVGVELPTGAVTNMSGYDPQRRTIDKRAQKENLEEVRDAVQMITESFGGGEVDLVSFEFPRALYEQGWNKAVGKDSEGNEIMEFHVPDENKREELLYVDKDTGAIQALPRKRLPNPYFDEDLRHIREQQGEEAARQAEQTLKRFISWDEFLDEYKKREQSEGDEIDVRAKAFSKLKDRVYDGQISTARGQIARIEDFREREVQQKEVIDDLKGSLQQVNGDKEALKTQLRQQAEQATAQGNFDLQRFLNQRIRVVDRIEQEDREVTTRLHDYDEEINQQKNNIAEIERRKNESEYFDKFARDMSVEGYAKAGMIAFEEQRAHAKDIKHNLQIGPEIGWPQFFGGHPEEFAYLIKNARKKMVQDLIQQGIKENQAQEAAKTHIKGLFDTGHLGMWLEHFRPDLPWEKRVAEFNKWYTEAVTHLEPDMISAIQAVDAASGAHAHLPPGQGIFPVVESVKALKKRGFTGPIVSEGHEEEKFGQGRILFKAWQAFDPRLRQNNYDQPIPWRQAQNGYFQRGLYSPGYMVASQSPPFGEYRPWAGGDQPIPFE